MPEHRTHFEAAAGSMALTDAILLYKSGAAGQHASAFASIHAVEHDDEGLPTIAAGAPLTRARLRQWAEALGRAAAPELLPAHALVAHADMLAWWTPARVRAGYFALSNPPPGLRRLSERTIVPVPYPAHLLVATRSGFGIFALPTSERPTADTELRHSPILNVFADGRLCWGNVPKLSQLGMALIPAFERAVFDSWSTHPNPGQDLTVTGKDGLVRLWDDLVARQAKRFPVHRLKPFLVGTGRHGRQPSAGTNPPLTVGRLIARWTR